MEQMPILRRTMKPEDLPTIFKRAFERELDRNILAQLSEPGRFDDHRTFNTHYARYFSLLAEKPYLLDGSTESFNDLISLGLSTADADAISVLAHTHRHQATVSAGYLADDLRSVGIEPTQNNLKATARLTAAAYREANIAACQDLDMPISPSDIWPLPPHLQKLADQIDHDRIGVVAGQSECIPSAKPSSASMWSSISKPMIASMLSS